jgi:hypothetical protein
VPGSSVSAAPQADLPDEASAAAALGKLLAQANGDHFPSREAARKPSLAATAPIAAHSLSPQSSLREPGEIHCRLGSAAQVVR